jgi:predicted NUDIX family NTP pyrophosphohydrolase
MTVSAGILVHRLRGGDLEFLLAHPGGPFWRNRNLGAWGVPKGVVEPGEAPLDAAIREFREETGLEASGEFRALAPLRQKGGKQVLCWTIEADLDLTGFKPGEFEMEWPPSSGRTARFPEIDRLEYFGQRAALEHILPTQAPLLREAAACAPTGRSHG